MIARRTLFRALLGLPVAAVAGPAVASRAAAHERLMKAGFLTANEARAAAIRLDIARADPAGIARIEEAVRKLDGSLERRIEGADE